MPGFDRTGPEGKGPKTGRLQGRCNPGNDTDLKDFPRGRGRGWRFRFRNQSDSVDNTKRTRRRWNW